MDIMLQRIIELLGHKHGSVKELAGAIGVSGNLISDWKAERAKSYPKYAPAIADHYGVSLDWLSGRSNEKKWAGSVTASRKEQGIAQNDLANLTEIYWRRLRDIELKKTVPTVSELELIAKALHMELSKLCEEYLSGGADQKEKPSLELGEPIGAITGIPIIASVKAGYNGLAVEDDTGEFVHIPSVMLRGRPSSECRAMHIRGDSMYPNMKDGDIVVVHIQQEAENGKVAVCIVNGDEGTIKRFFRYSDRVELWPDNPQIPHMVLRGEQLESFHIYGQAIALIREDL